MNWVLIKPNETQTITIQRADEAITVVVGALRTESDEVDHVFHHIMLSVDEEGQRVDLSDIEQAEVYIRAADGYDEAGV
mgnify:CR=1 FL=1|tara:strand:+ start:1137 stop:1373 length:237 start_codon:yes stop_codon:yes gene_type:complete